jgi:hypothetical protein
MQTRTKQFNEVGALTNLAAANVLMVVRWDLEAVSKDKILFRVPTEQIKSALDLAIEVLVDVPND